MPPKRKVPVLATIVSLFIGLTSLLAFLRLFVPALDHQHQHDFFLQQTVTFRSLYALQEALEVLGAIYLWKMKTSAWIFFAASFLLSISLPWMCHPILHMGWGTLIDYAITIAIILYARWVTTNWEATRTQTTISTLLIGFALASVPLKSEAQRCPTEVTTGQVSAIFRGSSGSTGQDGLRGSSGFTGTPGNTSPTYKRPGGPGSSGSSGHSGSRGGDGSRGPDIRITLALSPDAHCLEVHLEAQQHPQQAFWLAIGASTLTVRSEGGHGGRGGRGGEGGAGGRGGSGSPVGRNGSQGSRGSDGMTGHSGSPGEVSVVYAPEAAPYLSQLNLPADANLQKSPVPFTGTIVPN